MFVLTLNWISLIIPFTFPWQMVNWQCRNYFNGNVLNSCRSCLDIDDQVHANYTAHRWPKRMIVLFFLPVSQFFMQNGFRWLKQKKKKTVDFVFVPYSQSVSQPSIGSEEPIPLKTKKTISGWNIRIKVLIKKKMEEKNKWKRKRKRGKWEQKTIFNNR